MKKLTLTEIQKRFAEVNPFGTIIKQSTNKYFVYFDARDTRSEVEKEVDSWGIVSTDKRKMYTYNVSSLKQLAYKLKIDVSDYEKKSTVNEEWEKWLKEDNTDYSLDLFGE